MKVTEILIGLEHDNYVWTAKNPRQTLYVRIGKLAGVVKAAEGLYAAASYADAAPMSAVSEMAPVTIEAPAPQSEPSSY
jgi:hypothetical protein